MKLMVRQVEKSDVFGDLVRVHASHRPALAAGEICCVTANGRSTYAVARNTLANQRDVISLDDAMRRRLMVKDGSEYEFAIARANWWGSFLWAWQASNPVNRIAAQLAVLSVVLGAIGVLLGAISLYVSAR
jgi:hypothetical protein